MYSGTVESGSYIYNATNGEKERLGRIVRLQADKREDVKTVYAGEIAAAVPVLPDKLLLIDVLCLMALPLLAVWVAEMVVARLASHPMAANVHLDPTSLPAYHALALWLLKNG